MPYNGLGSVDPHKTSGCYRYERFEKVSVSSRPLGTKKSPGAGLLVARVEVGIQLAIDIHASFAACIQDASRIGNKEEILPQAMEERRCMTRDSFSGCPKQKDHASSMTTYFPLQLLRYYEDQYGQG